MAQLLQNRVLLSACFGAFTVLFTFVGMYSRLAPSLHTTFGINSQQLLLARVAGTPEMLLLPFGGRLVARYGSARIASGSFVLAAGGLGLETITESLPVLVVGSVVFVTGIAAAVPSFITLVGETAPSACGSAVALYACIQFIGANIGPLAPTPLQSIGFVGLCGVLAVVLLVPQTWLSSVGTDLRHSWRMTIRREIQSEYNYWYETRLWKYLKRIS